MIFLLPQDTTAPRGVPAEEHAGVARLQEGVLRVAGEVQYIPDNSAHHMDEGMEPYSTYQ